MKVLSQKLVNCGHTVGICRSVQEKQVNPKEVEVLADIPPNLGRQPIFLGRHALILAKTTSQSGAKPYYRGITLDHVENSSREVVIWIARV